MVSLQACLVKQRTGKSTQEGKFVIIDARYSGHLTIAVGKLLSTVKELPAAMSRGAN